MRRVMSGRTGHGTRRQMSEATNPRVIENARHQPTGTMTCDTIEMPGLEGRPRTWVFSNGAETKRVALRPRVSVDEALTIYRLVCNGAGIGIVSSYLCGPEIVAGRLGLAVGLGPDGQGGVAGGIGLAGQPHELKGFDHLRDFVFGQLEIACLQFGDDVVAA